MTKGKLIVCANHIGNLEDIPERTIQAIRDSNYIFCEYFHILSADILLPNKIDTRNKTIIEFEDGERHQDLALSILENGEDIVFICENGLPGFADDGTNLINFIHDSGHEVTLIPGPSILTASLAFAGLPSLSTDVYFLDLFKNSNEDKKDRIRTIKHIDATIVALDFNTTIEDTISIMAEELDENRICALCINIGMPGQKIIREPLHKLKDKSLVIKEEHFDGSYLTTIVIQSISKKS
jgi:16S rRNA (cytidine1402-2'-O)-methyltransferase